MLLQDANLTFIDYGARVQARIVELAAQEADVAAISITGPDSRKATIAQVRSAFQSAGGNTTWLPAAPALGSLLAVDYNLATWSGNTTAYMTCNLAIRGPEYLGTCSDMPVSCAVNSSDTSGMYPYKCNRVSDNGTVAGSISNSSYR
jgi:hypothetical protein